MTDPFESIIADISSKELLLKEAMTAFDHLDVLVHDSKQPHDEDEVIDTFRQYESGVTRRVMFERGAPHWLQVDVTLDGTDIGKCALQASIYYFQLQGYTFPTIRSSGELHLLSAIDDGCPETQLTPPRRQIISSANMALILLRGIIESVTDDIEDGSVTVALHRHSR